MPSAVDLMGEGPREYLEANVFPTLLPAIEKLLAAVKRTETEQAKRQVVKPRGSSRNLVKDIFHEEIKSERGSRPQTPDRVALGMSASEDKAAAEKTPNAAAATSVTDEARSDASSTAATTAAPVAAGEGDAPAQPSVEQSAGQGALASASLTGAAGGLEESVRVSSTGDVNAGIPVLTTSGSVGDLNSNSEKKKDEVVLKDFNPLNWLAMYLYKNNPLHPERPNVVCADNPFRRPSAEHAKGTMLSVGDWEAGGSHSTLLHDVSPAEAEEDGLGDAQDEHGEQPAPLGASDHADVHAAADAEPPRPMSVDSLGGAPEFEDAPDDLFGDEWDEQPHADAQLPPPPAGDAGTSAP